MALAAALHHSAGPSKKKVVERREEQEEEVYEAHVALRGLKTPPPGTRPGLPSEPAPQVKLDVAARTSVIDGLPTFALPVLSGRLPRPSTEVRSPFSSSSSWSRGSRRRRSSRWTSTCLHKVTRVSRCNLPPLLPLG